MSLKNWSGYGIALVLAVGACASQPLRRNDPVERLEQGLTSSEPSVRLQAATILAERTPPEAMARAQVALARETVSDVARQLLYYFAHLGGPESKQVIVLYQSHPNPEIARAAFDALVTWAHDGGQQVAAPPNQPRRPSSSGPERHSRPKPDEGGDGDDGESSESPYMMSPEGDGSYGGDESGDGSFNEPGPDARGPAAGPSSGSQPAAPAVTTPAQAPTVAPATPVLTAPPVKPSAKRRAAKGARRTASPPSASPQ